MLGLSTSLELRLAAYGALLASIVGWLLWHDHKLIASHDAELRATGAAVQAQAEKQIADLTVQHAATNAANQGKLDEALKTNAALGDTLDQRVRDFETYRRSHPNVARSAGGSEPAGQGECGAESCGSLASRALQDSDDLARSVGELCALLRTGQADRDSLTGLPK